MNQTRLNAVLIVVVLAATLAASKYALHFRATIEIMIMGALFLAVLFMIGTFFRKG